jgi:hypothetical protein
MPANPSADGLRRAPRVRLITKGALFSQRQKLRLLALNALPLAHLTSLALIAVTFPGGLTARITAATLWFFLLPPLLARYILRPSLPSGEITVPSEAFFQWWTTWQLQAVFNRLPFIEEILRIIPGAYSGWLRLWGAKIGRLTLWSPGVRILDRSLIDIGDDVVIGIDTRIVGHFGGLNAAGHSTFTLGLITIGDRCIIGASSLLAPGFTLAPDQATEALFLGTPFTRWQAGQRIQNSITPSSL